MYTHVMSLLAGINDFREQWAIVTDIIYERTSAHSALAAGNIDGMLYDPRTITEHAAIVLDNARARYSSAQEMEMFDIFGT